MEKNQYHLGQKVFRLKNGYIQPVIIRSIWKGETPCYGIQECGSGKNDVVPLSYLYKTETEAAKCGREEI